MSWLFRTFSVLRSAFAVVRAHWARAILFASVVLLLGCGGVVGYRHLWARHHFQIARLALERSDYDVAQQHLETCIQLRNDEPEDYLLAATTARRRDDYDRADAYLTTYEQLTQRGGTPCFERELLIAQQGAPESVRVYLETVMKDRPDQATLILQALGKGYLNSFVKADALTCFNALLKAQPDHAIGLFWRGKTYESLDRHDKALQDYRRAVELSPSLDAARLHLARALHRAGQSWEAIPHFECLLQRQPDSPESLLGMAQCRIDLHEVPEAHKCLSTLLASHPDHASALLELGRLDYHSGQTAEAEPVLRKAAALAPNDEDTQRTLLLCLKKQGKDSEVRTCLAQLEGIDAKLRQLDTLVRKTKDSRRDAPQLWEVGECLRRLGREEDAVSYYYAALGEDANYAPAHVALADYFHRTGQMYRAAWHRSIADQKIKIAG